MTVAHARATDPETSHAAAASVRDLRASQFAVLKVLRTRPAHGFTDEELIAAYERAMARNLSYPFQTGSGIRTRRSELVTQGFVEWSGVKRPLTTGRSARVWCVTK